MMSAEIVSLSRVRAARTHPVLVQVEAYWDALRNGRCAPARAEVDPRGLTGALHNCFILERIAPGLAQIRVAGQAINELMGLETRGLPFSTLFLPEARDTLEDALERVFAMPATNRLTVASPADRKRRRIEGQLLILPLRSDIGAISRALGCLVMHTDHGPRPRRLDITATLLDPVPEGRDLVRKPAPPSETAREDRPHPPGEVVILPGSGDAR